MRFYTRSSDVAEQFGIWLGGGHLETFHSVYDDVTGRVNAFTASCSEEEIKSSLLLLADSIQKKKSNFQTDLFHRIFPFHSHIASTPDIDRILYIEFSHHLQQTSSARNHRFYDADRCCARLFVFLLLCFNRFAKPFFNDVPISAMERLLEPFFLVGFARNLIMFLGYGAMLLVIIPGYCKWSAGLRSDNLLVYCSTTDCICPIEC